MSGAITSAPLKEGEWQRTVIDTARLFGWRVAHFRPAKTAHGWRTPVQADGAGFPDLVMTRGQQLLFVELKAAAGRVGPEQQAWLEALSEATSLPEHQGTYVWRPADWPEVERCLR